MKKQHLLCFIFITLVSCTGNEKDPATVSSADSLKKENSNPGLASTAKHVEWEIGDYSYVNKILELYKLWDEKKPYTTADYFADTLVLHIPEVRQEIILPSGEIAKKLAENREMYEATSNEIISSVPLHDKVSGEDWVMITAYSKWIEKDGTRDSVLYHDDWRLKNGKVDLLLSFYKLPPKGYKANPDK